MQSVFFLTIKLVWFLAFISDFITMDPQNMNLEGLTLAAEGLTLNLADNPDASQILDHCLIGRVLADREIKFAYFSERMSKAWKPVKRVTILKAEGDRYLFQFHHKMDAAKVLDDGPWLYDNFHLAIERIAPGAVPRLVNLNHLDIWVQVHGLPFGFIQQRVGQGIGQFLGELKSYDSRNSVHSSYMRLKVRIDVTAPLKKQWQVRTSNGNYVTIVFKYEKLGVFCYRCGLLGHTDKVCPQLFELDSDDGVRAWGMDLRPSVLRVGTAATNRWLQDPIPNAVPHTNDMPGGAQHVVNNNYAEGSSSLSNLGGRLEAVHNEISAIKQGILVAQTQAQVKNGKATVAVHLNHSFPASSVNVTADARHQLVLGLPAAPLQITDAEHVSNAADIEADDIRSELKKRKRMLAECLQSGVPQNDNDFSFAADGVNGDNHLGESVSGGNDDVMTVCENPLYENLDVSAGSDAQACRDK
jgi:hypothetical protein